MERFSINTQFFKKFVAICFACLFLWANYAVNYTSLHQHEEEHHHCTDKTHSEEEDCLVCDFQALMYEPLHQTFFNIPECFAEENFAPIFYNVISSELDTYYSISQRGPPHYHS